MKTYIYYLRCPIEKTVKYVGATKNPKTRFKQHITKLDSLNTQKKIWLTMLFEKKLLPTMEIIDFAENETEGREKEQYYVDLHKNTILNIHNPAKGEKSFKRYPKTDYICSQNN